MSLLAEGAFIGRLDELLTPEEYSIFVDKSRTARDFIQANKNLVTCKYDYSYRNDNEDHSISIDRVQERDTYVRENGLSIHQKWYYLNHGDLPNEYFRDLTVLITKKHYPDFPKDLSNQFWGNATFTLYEEGNFINDHKDGLDPDRLCVVLVYFSDPDSYTSDSGGELVVKTAHDEIKKVIPVLGNYCVLDFSQNNLDHNVLEVLGDFKRYAYIHFIESDDFIEHLHSQKKKLEIIETREKDLIEKIRSLEDENGKLIDKTEIARKKYTDEISTLKRENKELKEALATKSVSKKLI